MQPVLISAYLGPFSITKIRSWTTTNNGAIEQRGVFLETELVNERKAAPSLMASKQNLKIKKRYGISFTLLSTGTFELCKVSIACSTIGHLKIHCKSKWKVLGDRFETTARKRLLLLLSLITFFVTENCLKINTVSQTGESHAFALLKTRRY